MLQEQASERQRKYFGGYGRYNHNVFSSTIQAYKITYNNNKKLKKKKQSKNKKCLKRLPFSDLMISPWTSPRIIYLPQLFLFPKHCLIERKCNPYAKDTSKAGNHTMGNFVTIVFAGSFINTLNGVGKDKMAMVTMLSRSARQAKFRCNDKL